MRKPFVGLAILALCSMTAPLNAQTLGPTLAWESDLNLGVGATVRAPLSSLGEGIGIMTDFLIFFPDVGDYFELNGNLTYDLPLEESSAVPFLLAGLTIGRTSVDVLGISVSDTAARLNIGGGVEFDAGTFRPTAGLRLEFGDGDALVLFANLPFALGG